MTAALLTGPASEPVSLDEAKAHLRIDGDDDDALITAAIVAARVHVEAATRRALIEQGWRVYLDHWPKKRIVRIPIAPLVTVDVVTIYDANGDPQTVDPASYAVDTVSEPGRLVLKRGVAGVVGRTLNGIEIDVTAGYGPSGVDVPSPLRQALMMLVAHWYEHRGAVGHDLAGALTPYGFEALTAPYRVLQL